MSVKVITAPHVNVNDLEMVVVKWHVKPWQFVKKDDPICEVETAKAVIVVESDQEGHIYPVIAEQKNAKVGEPLAYVFPKDDPKQLESIIPVKTDEENVTVTKKARALMEEHGLSIADFPKFSVISTETVVAKIRETKGKEDLYDEGRAIVALENVRIDERSFVIYGEENQALLALDVFKIRQDFYPVAYISHSCKLDTFYGFPVVHPAALKLLKQRGLRCIYICGQNTEVKKAQAAECQELGLSILSCVHPSAVVSSSANLGKGVFIGAQVVIGPDAVIGDYCQVLNGATIAHHSKLGAYVVVSDGSHLGGNVQVGDCALIGIGANINKRVSIGKNVVLVSGSTVIDHVPDDHHVRLSGEIVPNKDLKEKEHC